MIDKPYAPNTFIAVLTERTSLGITGVPLKINVKWFIRESINIAELKAIIVLPILPKTHQKRRTNKKAINTFSLKIRKENDDNELRLLTSKIVTPKMGSRRNVIYFKWHLTYNASNRLSVNNQSIFSIQTKNKSNSNIHCDFSSSLKEKYNTNKVARKVKYIIVIK